MGLRHQAFTLIRKLPEGHLREALSFLEFLRHKEEWEATREIEDDPDLMKAWRRGREQVRRGKTIPWRDARKRV